MEMTLHHHIILLAFIKVVSFSSVAVIIYRLNTFNCWTSDMKYYTVYFLIALIGSLLGGIQEALNLSTALNILVSVYIGASVLLLLAIEPLYRKKSIEYGSLAIITSFFISTFFLNYGDFNYLIIHSIFSLMLYSLLFLITLQKGMELNNIGYFIFSVAFIIVVIGAILELFYLDNLSLVYTIARSTSSAGFVLVIIGFLAKILMDEYKILNTLAITDPLTGMNNRRGLHHLIQTVIPSSNRKNICFSIATIDIDFFKKINDTYGHDKGDIVLKEFSHIIKTTCRNSDISARFGGEEFVIVLPDTNKDISIAIAEKLRKKIEQSTLLLNDTSLNVTASFGVSTSCSEINIDNLLKDADKALYKAKANGRNRVVHIEDMR